MDPITAALVNLLIGVVISGVSTLAQQAFAPKPKAMKQLPGMRGQYTTGGTVPMTIVLGTYGVAGQLEYSNTWGNSGETPNAFLVDVISLSDYPVTAVTAQWIDTEEVTLPGTGAALRGLKIEVPAKFDGYAWYIHHLGDQTAADAYLLDKFGADSKRPWLSDMIGEGITYAVQTARINEALWTDFPRYMYELQGAPVFDPRESTAAGGSGSQVWGTFSTYTFSDNLAVLALNVLLGIRNPDGDFIWGGRATLAQFDYANLAAAMDRCDELVDRLDGGTERRYRGGIEISLNERPADVLRDIMVAANLRISFARGKFWFLVDEPESADASFTDGDLLIKEPIDFSWFPDLDSAVNGATATFLAKQRAWEERETKPYYRSDLETEDHSQLNREKLQLRCVYSASQAQRIIKVVVEQSRKFKRHVVCLPDTYRDYRPLQCLAWTSDEFQYSSKLFLIISRTEDEFGRIWFALQEIDPSDFDWDAETDETELTFASTEESPVPSQAVAGWAVEPWDDGGRRPGIHMEWTGALDDIRVTRVQIRHDGDTLPLLDREYPYETGEATQDIYLSGDPLLRDTTYNVRAKFIPFDGSGRETDWSDWLTVTTPDVGIGPEDLGPTLEAMNDFFSLRLRDLNEQMMLVTSGAADQDLANYSDKMFVLNEQIVGDATTYASSVEALLLAVGVDGTTLADALSAIETASGDATAGFLTRMTASASPGGGWVRYGTQIKAGFSNSFVTVSDFWEVNSVSGLSRRVMKASETYFVDDSNNILAMFGAGGASFNNAYIVHLTAANIDADSLTVSRLEIAARGLTFEDITFEHNVTTVGGSAVANRAAWTAGTVRYVNDAGNAASAAISAGSTGTWSSGVIYIYWVKGATSFSTTTSAATAYATNNVVVGTYQGGKKLVITWGKLVIDGSDSSGWKGLSLATGGVAANAITVGGADVETADTNITGTAEFPSLPTGWTTISSFSLTPDGGEVNIIASTDIFARANTAGSDGRVEVGIFNNSVSTTVPLTKRQRDFDVGAFEHADITLMARETGVGSSARTYALKVRCVAGGGGGTGSCNSCTAREGSGIIAWNFKK